jgi:hypothetical protein
VSRRGIVWLLTLPLAVVGSQVAHALAYRLTAPDDRALAHALETSGHDYLAYLPTVLAICAALVVVALSRELRLLLAGDTSRPGRPSLLTFAVLGPAIFVAQEHFERLAHGGSPVLGLALEPTFALGLVLQVPFAFVAYALASMLLRAARVAAVLLSRPRLLPRAPGCEEAVGVWSPHGTALRRRLGARAPPALPIV